MGTEFAAGAPAMITFTHVRLTDDLRYATVYYSCLGKEKEQELVAGFLEREKKKIRQLVGRNLRLRHIPELTFKFDPSIEEGIRIEQLLNEIKTDREE
jgi:ribosome-binding factor A